MTAQQVPEVVTNCPMCGAFSQTTLRQHSSLLAVCDVLVISFLKTQGKRIVRQDRSRFAALGSRPFYEAHVLWPEDRERVEQVLKGAWDVIPALMSQHGSGGITVREVIFCLDEYVTYLMTMGVLHSLALLKERLETRLQIEFP